MLDRQRVDWFSFRSPALTKSITALVIGHVLHVALTGRRGGIQWNMAFFFKLLDYADHICRVGLKINPQYNQ